MSELQCECGNVAVETCPVCKREPLCAMCREEFGACSECDDEAIDDGHDADDAFDTERDDDDDE